MNKTPDDWNLWLEWEDIFTNLGFTFVLANSNTDFNVTAGLMGTYQSDWYPGALVTATSPTILVGGTYHDGSLWEHSAPSGSRPGSGVFEDAEISIYAQSYYVHACSKQGDYSTEQGCSMGAPQVVSAA